MRHFLRQDKKMVIYYNICDCLIEVTTWVGLTIYSNKGYECKWTWETIYLYTYMKIKVKEQHFYCVLYFSHSRVFNNKLSSYPKMSMKQPLDYEYETAPSLRAVLFTSVDKHYI